MKSEGKKLKTAFDKVVCTLQEGESFNAKKAKQQIAALEVELNNYMRVGGSGKVYSKLMMLIGTIHYASKNVKDDWSKTRMNLDWERGFRQQRACEQMLQDVLLGTGELEKMKKLVCKELGYGSLG